MSAEEIADLCDSLTTRKIPQVGDTEEEVRNNYYDREPWNFPTRDCGRYIETKTDNVNCIYVSGVYYEGSEKNGGPSVKEIKHFGTGLVLEIYDYDKAMEFIRIMKERHPVLEEKPNGSWKSDDFVVGMTAIDYITYKNGIHFQIAYGEKSADARHFVKSEEIRKNFETSLAFETLMDDLVESGEYETFITGIVGMSQADYENAKRAALEDNTIPKSVKDTLKS